MKKSTKKLLVTVFCIMTSLCMFINVASACTMIYAGAATTADGTMIFARSEDFANSRNKLFYYSPAGNHTAGEEYAGCYGFTWTFTHDSYGYTAFRDDNGEGVEGVCPNCGETHAHTPYEAAGTNEMGVSITATETLYPSDAPDAVDPYEDAGIEEAEIVTVVLSEAATAKDAVALLTGIYDTVGANNGSGLIIADAQEAWYIENMSGHEYLAIKLNDTLIFAQPNMSMLGLIDLDDENVIASPTLIETAQKGGFLVGDAEQNTINYALSFCGGSKANARMLNALPYLDPTADTESGYLISNVGDDGQIVPFYTNIKPDHLLTIEDIQGYYHISNIGYANNLDTHIFQISGEGAYGTVEWVCMDAAEYGLFVPYYPMLTTDVDASYKLSTAPAVFSEEQPEGGFSYPATVTKRVNGERVQVAGFKALPTGWQDSMYWSYDALSNLVLSGMADDAQKAVIVNALAEKQAAINADFAALAETTPDADAATAWSMTVANTVHQQALDLLGELAK